MVTLEELQRPCERVISHVLHKSRLLRKIVKRHLTEGYENMWKQVLCSDENKVAMLRIKLPNTVLERGLHTF